MKNWSSLIIVFLCGVWQVIAQHSIDIEATLDSDNSLIRIEQTVFYKNTSNHDLDQIYFNNWPNSFSEKTTPLAKRFAENYDASFHFEKYEQRGRTSITEIKGVNNSTLSWTTGDEIDVLIVQLKSPVHSGETVTIKLNYVVKIPDSKFTRYGVNDDGDFLLKHWYIVPAVYTDNWQAYSNKNLNDLFEGPNEYNVTLVYPSHLHASADLNVVLEDTYEDSKVIEFSGSNRKDVTIYLENTKSFKSVVTDKFEVISNLKDSKVSEPLQALVVDRIAHYLHDKLGDYPFDKMLISQAAYKSSPVYGLNQLPSFISPFPDGFEYDMEHLKTMSRNYIENTLFLNPRSDYWLYGAIQIYLMMDYVNTFYPNMKIIGKLSDFWVIKWSHASDLEFNDQYPLLYLNMARANLHQSLVTPKDSLLKFNQNIANDYYAGSGFKYLADYIGKEEFDKSLKEFYSNHKLHVINSNAFQKKLEEETSLPVAWFFTNYVGERSIIDFKITKVTKANDSLKVTIKNKRSKSLPVALYGINKDEIKYKIWSPPIDSTTTLTIPANGIKQLAVNYEGIISEFNQRNNFKNVKGVFNRPVQFRLFQDVEDPKYNQLFFMPIFEYNLYDGLTTGLRLYNKTVLQKGLNYSLEPQYGYRSKTLIGGGSVSYTQQFYDDETLYATRYGISGNYYSYNEGLFYRRISPYLTFAYRNNDDLRNNEKQFINLRNVNVIRDENPQDPDQEPNYNVFNLQYVYSNPNLINYYRGVLDYQLSSRFSKISATFEYRKLFLNNRQLNLRAFAGIFLFNDTSSHGDFFSFALDRPTDYLFDYNYYGRSEDSGLFSQQLIIAEGGFKSQLEPAFSNSWITTINASTNIWKWIYAYGDVGLVGNKQKNAKAVFDSGIRLSLVADYFELYFPLYSNLGFEPNLPDYDQKIRFIVTLSPSTLFRLFTREWY